MAKGPKPMRNWAACDPLMRKGGAHQEAKLTQRPRLDWRQALDEFDDWQDDQPTNEMQGNNEGPKGPSFLSRHALNITSRALDQQLPFRKRSTVCSA